MSKRKHHELVLLPSSMKACTDNTRVTGNAKSNDEPLYKRICDRLYNFLDKKEEEEYDVLDKNSENGGDFSDVESMDEEEDEDYREERDRLYLKN